MKYAILIIILSVMAGTFLFLVYWMRRIRRKINSFSREVFGTESILEGAAKMKAEYAATPKSVSAMTSLCLPKITKDFPDFNYNEMKTRANNLLTSYLLAIEEKNPDLLQEGNTELKNKVSNYIQLLNNQNSSEHFRDISIHRTEISGYRKDKGRCIITFQSSLEYYHYLTDSGNQVIVGEKELTYQTRFEVDLIYIQDRSLVEQELDHALGINCPNCGAPLTSLGAKVCVYCDSPVIELNIHAWSFSDVREVN